MSKVGAWIAVAFLLLTGASGIQGSMSDWAQAEGPGQRTCTVAVALMGFLGVGGAVGALFRRSWTRHVILAWGLCVALASALAPMAWGDAGLATGVASGILGAGLAALTYVGIRRRVGPPRAD
jgi:hypothetical protein